MSEPHIRVFLDDQAEPISEHTPPADVTIDTKGLTDGEHRVRIVATDRTGATGMRHIPFLVRNGPGITISGLVEGATVHGAITFMVNAFGAEEPFEPHRAESRAPVPVWVWVLLLVVVAWAGWYLQTEWQPPQHYIDTPTYAVPTIGRLR
ncbi:MAG: hypothetical protein ACREFP_18165 [Acetobacteraceae bacterium]